MNLRSNGFSNIDHEFDVCVVGGGMAGLCAAIASARNGAKTVLVHDRPVLGGNASSEIRMWICGAPGQNMKETGILEEIQLENCFRNPTMNYSVWDSVLYEKAAFCDGLTLLLNASVHDGQMDGDRLESVRAWQLTNQTFHTIHAKLFIDCSGDSVLAPITGALFRQGREARAEFDEDIEPSRADNRTMGNTLLIQLRQTDEPQPFAAPRWAYKFRSESDLPNRSTGGGDNFWWLELGGLSDTIRDAESIRHELMCVGYGVMDYIKNHGPHRDKLEHWGLEWMGSLPGKRENRRYVGQHVLTQNDVRAGGNFKDIVAYGGWSMDDHHPAGLLYPGQPTLFHAAPSPYGIPYRCLFSASVPNLMMAGRNISVTHAALSSTRVMATTSLLGQAAGTAAALCIKNRCDPASIYSSHLSELQQTLMDDDLWLPGVQRPRSELTLAGKISATGAGTENLADGHDRKIGEQSHLFQGPLGSPVTLEWPSPVTVHGLRLVLDSNLAHSKVMPCKYPSKGNKGIVPATMLRSFRVEAKRTDGSWQVITEERNNYQRLVRVNASAQTAAIRFTPLATWGADVAHVFSLDVLQSPVKQVGHAPEGRAWADVVASVPKVDLAPPESGLEKATSRHFSA